MKFRKIEIGNFKSFSNIQTANLAPITLIYGPNSSGKSSLIQSLLFLSQSFKSILFNGKYVDLGSYETAVYQHDINKNITLGLELNTQNLSKYFNSNIIENIHKIFIQIELKYNPDNLGTQVLKYILDISYEEKCFKLKFKASSPPVQEINLTSGFSKNKFELLPESFEDFYQYILCVASQYPSWKKIIDSLKFKENNFFKILKEIIQNKFIAEGNLIPESIKFLPSYLSNTVSNLGNLFRINQETLWKSFLDFSEEIDPCKIAWFALFIELPNIIYLGPLRSYQERIYTINESDEIYVGKTGESVANFLLKNPFLIDSVNQWFEKFDIPYSLRLDHLKSQFAGYFISLILADSLSGTVVSTKDVGFGISQILPIIVQSLICQQAIICVEQPEIHLHPRLQAQIADLIIESTFGSSVTPKSQKQLIIKNQWLVETHSEILLKRLLRRVKEGIVKAEHISVLFVEPSKYGSRIKQLRVSEQGELKDEWPHGFFDDDYYELMEQIFK